MTHSSLFFYVLLLCLFSSFTVYAQGSSNYTLALVTAKVTDQKDQKDVVVIYSVSSKDSINFPPVFTFPPKCSIIGPFSRQQVQLGPHNMGVVFVDRDIKLKNPEYYELVKSKVNLSQKAALMFLIFELHSISFGKVEKMEMEVLIRETKNQIDRDKHFFSFEVIQ